MNELDLIQIVILPNQKIKTMSKLMDSKIPLTSFTFLNHINQQNQR
jgi:hypothetical protein